MRSAEISNVILSKMLLCLSYNRLPNPLPLVFNSYGGNGVLLCECDCDKKVRLHPLMWALSCVGLDWLSPLGLNWFFTSPSKFSVQMGVGGQSRQLSPQCPRTFS